MAKIAVVWELGHGLGHVNYLAAMAERLQLAGHEVTALMQEVYRAHRLMAHLSMPVLPAPRMPGTRPPPGGTVNYAEILISCGYIVDGALLYQIKAWRELFQLVGAELVIANHAPSAILAARSLNLPVVNFGTGFALPPPGNPMPSLMPWAHPDKSRMLESEARVLTCINQAFQQLGVETCGSLSEALEPSQNLLTTIPELDHYPGRSNAKYWGALQDPKRGDAPDWPGSSHGDKRIFAYLKPSHSGMVAALEALKAIPAEVVVFMPGITETQAHDFSGVNVRVHTNPLSLEGVCDSASLVVCHAGHGTVYTAVTRGVPVALMPERQQLEQMITAYNAERLDFGFLCPILDADSLADLFMRKLSDPDLCVGAEKIRARHSQLATEKAWEGIMRELIELMEEC